jgi:hypothetical protein
MFVDLADEIISLRERAGNFHDVLAKTRQLLGGGRGTPSTAFLVP